MSAPISYFYEGVGEEGPRQITPHQRMLLEIAHSPSQMDASQLDELREEIKERGLLFKIRVLGSTVQREESTPASKQSKTQEGLKL